MSKKLEYCHKKIREGVDCYNENELIFFYSMHFSIEAEWINLLTQFMKFNHKMNPSVDNNTQTNHFNEKFTFCDWWNSFLNSLFWGCWVNAICIRFDWVRNLVTITDFLKILFGVNDFKTNTFSIWNRIFIRNFKSYLLWAFHFCYWFHLQLLFANKFLYNIYIP